MKRFLSMMLAVMLILSSFVMVSASEDTFSVIKVTGTETFAFEAINGYYEISADVYVTADVAEPTIEATLAGEKVAEGAIDLEKKDQWQTVKLSLVNEGADALKFAVTSGAMYVNNIKIDKAYAKTLVYEENFDNYKAGEKVYYAKNFIGNGPSSEFSTSAQTQNPMTSFKIATDIGDKSKVGVIEQPNYQEAAYRFDDNGDIASGVKMETSEGNEYFVIDVPTAKTSNHLIVEFDLYNAANSLSTDTYTIEDKTKINDVLRFSVIGSDKNNPHSTSAPSVLLGLNKIRSYGRHYKDDGTLGQYTAQGNPSAAPQEWNKVVYELKKETVDGKVITNHTVRYGGSNVSATNIGAYDKLDRLVFNVDPKYGGKFYIDNLKVYSIDEITDGYVERYAENFDGENMVVGENAGFVTTAVTGGSTFTVDSTYDADTNPKGKGRTGNPTQYGRLYDPKNPNGATRFFDDGTEDTNVNTTKPNYRESFFKPAIADYDIGVSKVGDTKKTRLTFKYYLPGSAMKDGKYVDNLQVGFGNTLGASEAYGVDIKEDKITLGGNYIIYEAKSTDVNVQLKRWIPVTLDVLSTVKQVNEDAEGNKTYLYTHLLTLYSGDVVLSKTITNQKYLAPRYIALRMSASEYGGIAYIDDIKVEKNFLASDYESEKSKGNLAFENVLTKSADVKSSNDEFKVTAGTFGSSPQSINIYKMPGNTASVKVVTAVYNGDVLYDAAINDIPASNLTEFAETTVELTDTVAIPSDISEYKFKVFVFDTEAGLKPLADMFSDNVVIETPAE